MRLRALLLVSVVLTTACGGPFVKSGDRAAKSGDWEKALVEYRDAAAHHPTNATLDRVARAERKVAMIWTQRGDQALAAGKVDEAADWWKRSLDLQPKDVKPTSAREHIRTNAAALETFADAAGKDKRYDSAFKAYAALLAVFPERTDLYGKSQTLHKQFASELDARAIEMAKRGLTGAALATDLRALHNDPLQPDAFGHADGFRKDLRGRTQVAVQGVAMADNGWWGLGSALVPRLTRRLGQYPPYGPTKSSTAVPAVFKVTIEDFSWWDKTEHGYETRVDKRTGDAQKVANPEKATQQAIVDQLTTELKVMEASMAAAADPAPSPTPAPKGKKAAPAPTPAPRTPPAARAPTPDEVAAKRAELDAATQKLAGLPDEITLAAGQVAWTLAFKDVTRTAKAKVRFELVEPDFPEPVVLERELTAGGKDRTFEANLDHGVQADPLELPTVEALIGQLADQYADGIDVLKSARDRRAHRFVEEADRAHTAGQEDEAVDAYVSAVFVGGADALSHEQRDWLLAHTEGADVAELTK